MNTVVCDLQFLPIFENDSKYCQDCKTSYLFKVIAPLVDGVMSFSR